MKTEAERVKDQRKQSLTRQAVVAHARDYEGAFLAAEAARRAYDKTGRDDREAARTRWRQADRSRARKAKTLRRAILAYRDATTFLEDRSREAMVQVDGIFYQASPMFETVERYTLAELPDLGAKRD